MNSPLNSKINLRIPERMRARVNQARLKRIAQHALNAEHARGEITIAIVTNARIRTLNRTYHATDAPTDILTFPFDDKPDAPRPYLGDIVISYDTARANAHAAHWSLDDELDLLVVHGILHLCGYTDTTKFKRAKMWKRQVEILERAVPST